MKRILCGYKGQVATSADGVNWTAQASGTTELIYDVVWGGGNFVASVMEGHVLNSEDGIHWIVTDLGARITSFPGPGPVYGNGTWIILHGGTVYWSKDLKHWNRERSRHAYSPALYEFGEFIASGHRRLFSSSDGSHWHPRTDKHVTRGRFAYSGFQAAARFQQQIVFVGHGGRISVSGIWP